MKKVLLLIFLLIFLTGCKQDPDTSTYLVDGQQYLANMEYNKALQAFEAGRFQNPADPNYYLSIAEIALKKGNTESAIATLYDGYTNTSSTLVSNAIGEILIKQGDFEGSLGWFEKTLAQVPKDRSALKGKFRVLSLRGDTEELKSLVESWDSTDFDSDMYIMSAVIDLEDTSKAADLILKSGTVDDKNLELAKELRMALTGYEKAKTVHNLGRIVYVLLNFNQFELAQIPTSTIQKQNEFYETGYIYQGLIELYTNQLTQSQETFNKVLEINPNNIDAKIFLIHVYYLQEDFESTSPLITQVAGDPEANLSLRQYQSLQEILHKNQEYEKIETLYSNFSPKLELPADQALVVIESLLELRKFNQADVIVSKINKDYALLSGSEQAMYKALSAYTSFHIDRRQQAQDLILEAEQVDNKASIVHYYKGVMLFEDGDLEQAALAFERAKELDLEGRITSRIQKLTGNL